MRLTIVRVKVPFWRRVWALIHGELILGVMGTVQDVAVISRSDAQDLLDHGHEKQWLPYQDPSGHAAPAKGPVLGDDHQPH